MERLVHLLRELDAQPPFALLDVLRSQLSRHFDALDTQLWLVDYAHQWLQRLRVGGDGALQPARELDSVNVEDDGPGEVFRSQQTTMSGGYDQAALIRCPVTVRTERLGVLEIAFDQLPRTAEMTVLESVGSMAGHALLTARRYTDLFERVRRRQELHVAAELQWDLLPVLTHNGPDFSVAGMLEPAYDIAGDNFDYAVGPEGIFVSVSDAMGHGLTGAMVSNLGVAVLRNTRRQGCSLRQQARSANIAVHDQFDGHAFLTNLTLRIDRRDGSAAALNAGHSHAFLLRDRAVESIEPPSDLPLGMFPDSDYTEHPLQFRRGDRLLLLTDGVLEASPDGGREFGDRRVATLLRDTAACEPFEAVRKLISAVLSHRSGPLRDDATAVCIDYRLDGR